MGLGPFTLISLLYVLIGIRVVFQLARNFRQTFSGCTCTYQCCDAGGSRSWMAEKCGPGKEDEQ